MTVVIKHFQQVLPLETVPRRFRAHADEEALFQQSFHIPPGGAFCFTPAVNQTKLGEALAGVPFSLPADSAPRPLTDYECSYSI